MPKFQMGTFRQGPVTWFKKIKTSFAYNSAILGRKILKKIRKFSCIWWLHFCDDPKWFFLYRSWNKVVILNQLGQQSLLANFQFSLSYYICLNPSWNTFGTWASENILRPSNTNFPNTFRDDQRNDPKLYLEWILMEPWKFAYDLPNSGNPH